MLAVVVFPLHYITGIKTAEVNLISKNFQKTIDITEDLWQNILVEIPLKCVNDKNKDLTLEGDGWRLISEDDVKLENNPLSSLKDLL